MAGKLQGRNAVVTGAGRGIGREWRCCWPQEGANVVVNDPGVNSDGTGHDNGPAEQVVAEIKAAGGNAVANTDTVATAEGGENMVRQCVDAFGRIDILMNVAGILRDRMIFNMTEEEWDAVIAVHLKGHFNTIKPASVLMRQQRYGRIVNFSSISGLRGHLGAVELRRGEGGNRRADASSGARPRPLRRDLQRDLAGRSDSADGDDPGQRAAAAGSHADGADDAAAGDASCRRRRSTSRR